MKNRVQRYLGNGLSFFSKLILLLIVVLVINLILLSIQSVTFYEIKPSEGKRFVLGFDRGLLWIFNDWDMETGDNGYVKILNEGEVYASGYILSEKKDEISALLNSLEAKLIFQVNKNKLNGGIYSYEDKTALQEYSDSKAIIYTTSEYLYYAVFEKNRNYAVFLRAEKNLNEEEIVDLFSRLRGTRGIGHWLAQIVSTLFSDD